MSIACYTAIIGGYDNLPPHPSVPGVDFHVFLDQGCDRQDWEVHPVTNASDFTHPRVTAKWFKLHPHLCLPGYDRTVWIDGSHEVLDPKYINDCLSHINHSGIALHKHPARDCIYEEAAASLTYPEKYGSQPITEQVEFYRGEGHPEHWGLWATGTLARDNTKDVATVMESWWAENLEWTYQDQLSFPVACRLAGIVPGTFPWAQFAGNVRMIGHNRPD